MSTLKHTILLATARASLTGSLLLASAGLLAATCNTTTLVQTDPSTNYTDNANGTVTDNQTGLTWMKCSQGMTWSSNTCGGTASTYTWTAALSAAQTANSGSGTFGQTDWRLPNVNELGSLVENRCHTPAANDSLFAVTSGNYWTSSPDFNTATNAWYVAFTDGAEATATKNNTYYVRLVRGGSN